MPPGLHPHADHAGIPPHGAPLLPQMHLNNERNQCKQMMSNYYVPYVMIRAMRRITRA